MYIGILYVGMSRDVGNTALRMLCYVKIDASSCVRVEQFSEIFLKSASALFVCLLHNLYELLSTLIGSITTVEQN